MGRLHSVRKSEASLITELTLFYRYPAEANLQSWGRCLQVHEAKNDCIAWLDLFGHQNGLCDSATMSSANKPT